VGSTGPTGGTRPVPTGGTPTGLTGALRGFDGRNPRATGTQSDAARSSSTGLAGYAGPNRWSQHRSESRMGTSQIVLEYGQLVPSA